MRKSKRRGGQSLKGMTERERITSLSFAVHRSFSVARLAAIAFENLPPDRDHTNIWGRTIRIQHSDEMTFAHLNALAMALIYCAIEAYICLGFKGADPGIDNLLNDEDLIAELKDFRDALFHPHHYRDPRLHDTLDRAVTWKAVDLIQRIASFCETAVVSNSVKTERQ